MESSDRIYLGGIDCYAYHGVLPEERERGQRFLVDLVLEVDLRPGGVSDRLEDTVDYAEVYEGVRAVVEGEPRQLIERVAEDVAAAVLGTEGRVRAVGVTLRKPQAPLPGIVGEVAVEIHRRRA
mgnify:FL=1